MKQRQARPKRTAAACTARGSRYKLAFAHVRDCAGNRQRARETCGSSTLHPNSSLTRICSISESGSDVISWRERLSFMCLGSLQLRFHCPNYQVIGRWRPTNIRNLVGVGTGWDWLTLIGYGDYMNFLGIAFLCGLTIACYLRVLPFSLQRKDFVSGAILVLEVILLSVAASGLLAAGH